MPAQHPGDGPAPVVSAAGRLPAQRRPWDPAALVEDSTDAIVQLDVASAVICYWNRGAEQTFDVPAAEAIGRTAFEVFVPPDRRDEAQRTIAVVASGRPFHNPRTLRRRADGALVYVSMSVTPVRDGTGRVVAATSVMRDVTEQVRAEQALADSERWHRLVLETAREAILMTQPDGRIVLANKRCAELLGEQVRVGAYLLDVLPFDQEPGLQARAERHLAGEGAQSEMRLADRDGEQVWVHVSAAPLVSEETFRGSVVTFTDISEHKRAERLLRAQAFTDPLTGLPNRALLQDRLERLLHPHRDPRTAAVLFADLDGFKHVNDSLGHDAGDRLLRELGDRIRSVVPASDTVARLGGDEFAILCEDVTPLRAVEIANRILAVVAPTLRLDGVDLTPTMSIGIALGSDERDVTHLLRDADTAMYQAKSEGGGKWVIFAPEQHEAALRRLTTISDLRAALHDDQLRVYYQPQLCLSARQFCGAEALIRWSHPTRGLLGPDEFVPLAEETGLITAIDLWITERTIRQACIWQRGTALRHVSVNLSARDLANPELGRHILDTLAAHDAQPDVLTVELTETALLRERAAAESLFADLRAAGVRISIDDFGTGYSSIDYLRRFPVAEVKLDRTFITDLAASRQDRDIVRAAIQMAHATESIVVAEGVENAEQLDILADLGCDRAQGYYLARPAPADAVTPLFAPRRR